MKEQTQVGLPANTDGFGFGEHYLQLVCEQWSVVRQIIDAHGDTSLDGYLGQMLTVTENPVQSRNDLLEAVDHYTTPLLGKAIAEKAASELETLPAVLTAHHHGVDFMAQSVQSSLLFSLREVNGKPATTVPVFACGNVALNNLTYPQGLLLYDGNWQAENVSLPTRLPVFPNKYKRKSVSMSPAYDAAMLVRAEQRLQKMVDDEKLAPALGAAAKTVLKKDYRCCEAMEQKSYSQQAVVLNNRIWKRCFHEPERAPEMVYLELEEITNRLLQRDLRDENSLAWQMMFNPMFRAVVLKQLDGVSGCWDQGKLARRAHLNLVGETPGLGGCGTSFFWAVNDAGWRVPLYLMGGAGQATTLCGRDDQDKLWTIPFTPEDVRQGLQTGRLLPSLFTSYSTIGFARGISCCGGYYQADYLSEMHRRLSAAARELTEFTELSDRLSQVPNALYLSGMQVVMRKVGDKLLVPAGPIEMIGSGGLTESQLEGLRRITVREAHLASLIETLPDVQRKEDRPVDWYLQLAEENNRLLLDRVVVI